MVVFCVKGPRQDAPTTEVRNSSRAGTSPPSRGFQGRGKGGCLYRNHTPCPFVCYGGTDRPWWGLVEDDLDERDSSYRARTDAAFHILS